MTARDEPVLMDNHQSTGNAPPCFGTTHQPRILTCLQPSALDSSISLLPIYPQQSSSFPSHLSTQPHRPPLSTTTTTAVATFTMSTPIIQSITALPARFRQQLGSARSRFAGGTCPVRIKCIRANSYQSPPPRARGTPSRPRCGCTGPCG